MAITNTQNMFDLKIGAYLETNYRVKFLILIVSFWLKLIFKKETNSTKSVKKLPSKPRLKWVETSVIK